MCENKVSVAEIVNPLHIKITLNWANKQTINTISLRYPDVDQLMIINLLERCIYFFITCKYVFMC